MHVWQWLILATGVTHVCTSCNSFTSYCQTLFPLFRNVKHVTPSDIVWLFKLLDHSNVLVIERIFGSNFLFRSSTLFTRKTQNSPQQFQQINSVSLRKCTDLAKLEGNHFLGSYHFSKRMGAIFPWSAVIIFFCPLSAHWKNCPPLGHPKKYCPSLTDSSSSVKNDSSLSVKKNIFPHTK